MIDFIKANSGNSSHISGEILKNKLRTLWALALTSRPLRPQHLYKRL